MAVDAKVEEAVVPIAAKEEAVEEVAKAHDTMRKLGIKFENDKGGNIEDPVAAAFKEKEEGWYNEREVLEKQIAALEVEAAGLKEENEKQMEVRRALFAAMPRSSPYPIRDFFPPPLHPSNSSSSARSARMSPVPSMSHRTTWHPLVRKLLAT